MNFFAAAVGVEALPVQDEAASIVFIGADADLSRLAEED